MVRCQAVGADGRVRFESSGLLAGRLPAGGLAAFDLTGRAGPRILTGDRAECAVVQVIFADADLSAGEILLQAADRTLAGISLGQSDAEVEAKLGRPEQEISGDGNSFSRTYRGNMVEVQYVVAGGSSDMPRPGKVWRIRLKEGKTPRGLGIGESVARARDLYGIPVAEEGGILRYQDFQGRHGWFGLRVYVNKGRVEAVEIEQSR